MKHYPLYSVFVILVFEIYTTIMSKRFSLKIIGAAGQGILSVGNIVTKALKRSGYYVFGYREHPSLIKGGMTTFQVDVAPNAVFASEIKVDIIVALNPDGLYQRLFDLKPHGILVHVIAKPRLKPEHEAFIAQHNIQIVFVPLKAFLSEHKLKPIFSNIYMLGVLWKIIGLEKNLLQGVIEQQFASKPALLKKDIVCLEAGMEYAGTESIDLSSLTAKDRDVTEDFIIDAAHSLCLGAIHAGATSYFAYPMSPATSTFTHMANLAKSSNILVKQAEDEITAAIMTAGSMHMGSRAFTGTSGGGFDLMTEAISMVGITETPWVCMLAQRPGPATGMPTWTAQGDLTLAVYGGHGEFPRCVLAAADAKDAFRLMGEAFNIADVYQIPVIVMLEKQNLENFAQVEKFETDTPIDRGQLVVDPEALAKIQSMDRFNLDSEDGISPRWLPGSEAQTFDANTDEHLGDGTVTEDAVDAAKSIAKRQRKLETLRDALADPLLVGAQSGKILFVGWGSTKMVLDDVFANYPEIAAEVGYLHYEYLWPLRTACLSAIFDRFEKVVLMEGNNTGQLGRLLKQEADFFVKFDDKYLKYNGRPYFIDEVVEYVTKNV